MGGVLGRFPHHERWRFRCLLGYRLQTGTLALFSRGGRSGLGPCCAETAVVSASSSSSCEVSFVPKASERFDHPTGSVVRGRSMAADSGAVDRHGVFPFVFFRLIFFFSTYFFMPFLFFLFFFMFFFMFFFHVCHVFFCPPWYVHFFCSPSGHPVGFSDDREVRSSV